MAHNMYKERTVTCIGCDKTVTKRMPKGRNYCSQECYRSTKRPNRVTSTLHKCEYCNSDIMIVPSKKLISKSGKFFCCKVCHDKHQSRNKLKFVCKVCDVDFYVSKSVPVNHGQDPKYCSIECRNKCPEWKFNSVITGNLNQQNRKEPTSLEIAGALILKDIGVHYSEQVLIVNKFTVDVLLDEYMIVIQFDGDYWHGFRKEGDNTPLDKRQQKRVSLDKSQDAYMRKCGYTILRFWEHEVKQQPEKVSEDIKRAIQQVNS